MSLRQMQGKLVDPRTKARHDDEFSSQIPTMDTSQEVYEDIDTNESSHSVSSVKNEALMQDVKRSVDIEEVQDITDGNSYDNIDFDFYFKNVFQDIQNFLQILTLMFLSNLNLSLNKALIMIVTIR
ncbi:13115_t:CDS:1 [Funneliformis caledonium]|uniref:13115_t:CDS:1 n=1 Tax=Funneliformis caledonium TaxID=1117310 RepID=A0A9N9HIG9_9GLOM|nr:13115_t:CDS:1 [Funneliformis caledonium]